MTKFFQKFIFQIILRYLYNSTLSPVREILLFTDNHTVTSIIKHSKDFIKRTERTTKR